MLNHFTPVAAITAGASGGLAQWNMYGAAAIAPLGGGGGDAGPYTSSS